MADRICQEMFFSGEFLPEPGEIRLAVSGESSNSQVIRAVGASLGSPSARGPLLRSPTRSPPRGALKASADAFRLLLLFLLLFIFIIFPLIFPPSTSFSQDLEVNTRSPNPNVAGCSHFLHGIVSPVITPRHPPGPVTRSSVTGCLQGARGSHAPEPQLGPSNGSTLLIGYNNAILLLFILFEWE